MNTFELQVWYDESSLCTFYTVRKEGNDESETDKFFNRFEDEENEYFEEAMNLLRLITSGIGDKYGAVDAFFNRTEDRAYALPPRSNDRIEEIEVLGKNFPLRLYCYRICESIVVLFNGGVKDAQSALDSDDVRSKFRDAQYFAKRIEEAIEDEMIFVDSKQGRLIDFKGNSELIL